MNETTLYHLELHSNYTDVLIDYQALISEKCKSVAAFKSFSHAREEEML